MPKQLCGRESGGRAFIFLFGWGEGLAYKLGVEGCRIFAAVNSPLGLLSIQHHISHYRCWELSDGYNECSATNEVFRGRRYAVFMLFLP